MTSKKGAPSGVVDLLRLFVILFCAGVGYQVSQHLDASKSVLGPFNGASCYFWLSFFSPAAYFRSVAQDIRYTFQTRQCLTV